MIPQFRRRVRETAGALIETLIKVFVPVGGVVLDLYAGSGVVGEVAAETGRRAVLIDQVAKAS